MMTEEQFLNRFQRQPNGEWACTKPIRVNGPSGPVMIDKGAQLTPRSPVPGTRSRQRARSDGCKASTCMLLDRLRSPSPQEARAT